MQDCSTKIVLGTTRNPKGQVLIVQRKKKEKGKNKAKLSWAFPGGTIKENKTKESALIREVKEETGYFIKPISVISERQHPNFSVYIYYLACELTDKKPLKNINDEDIDKHKWYFPSELKTTLHLILIIMLPLTSTFLSNLLPRLLTYCKIFLL